MLNSEYKRVLPRDLFNEAKLLKCIGVIALMIHDEKIKGLDIYHKSNEGFNVSQDDSDGSITINNLEFTDSKGEHVSLYTSLNSRGNYPLTMYYKDNEYYPLNELGEYQLDENLFIEG